MRMRDKNLNNLIKNTDSAILIIFWVLLFMGLIIIYNLISGIEYINVLKPAICILILFISLKKKNKSLKESKNE